MKTELLAIAMLLATSGLLAQEAAPTTDAAPEPAPNTAAEDSTAATMQEDGTDEIDLEEDDDAIAAKKPQIKGEIPEGVTTSLVDIDCDDATLADILRQFRKTTGANIISDDSTNLSRRVSVSLRRVPWLQGLQAILGSRGFRLDERENIFRVVEDLQATPVSTRNFQLNHASAKELCELFNKSYGVKDPNSGKYLREVASYFEGANVVVVSAPEKVISDCEAIIKAVDKAVAQIYIEARFMELSSSALHELGLQWDSLQKTGLSLSKINYTVNDAAVKATDGNRVSDAPSTTLAGSNFVNDRHFTGTIAATDFGLYMSAFEKVGGTQIFSNPKVIVSNGKEALIDMTTKYPNLKITSQRNNSGATTYTDYTASLEQIQGDKGIGLFAGNSFYSWGIELSVKPRISPDGIISVEITPSISQLDTDVTSDGFYQVQGGSSGDAADTAAYGKYPIINMKRIVTNFSMKDGSTAVIGGLSRTVEEDVDTGIPFLREIPWAGPRFFGWKSRQKIQKEIVICVTLGIANPEALPKDMGLPTNAIFSREYIEGIRKEPGFRGSASDAMKIDIRPLDEQSKDYQSKPGTVTITPVIDSNDMVGELKEESEK